MTKPHWCSLTRKVRRAGTTGFSHKPRVTYRACRLWRIRSQSCLTWMATRLWTLSTSHLPLLTSRVSQSPWELRIPTFTLFMTSSKNMSWITMLTVAHPQALISYLRHTRAYFWILMAIVSLICFWPGMMVRSPTSKFSSISKSTTNRCFVSPQGKERPT